MKNCMASIVERNNSVSVVYYYEDEDGTKKQKWETVKKDQIDAASVAALTEKRKKERTKSAKRTAASARKTEVEFTQRKGTFIIPKKVTVREFLVDFVSLYGERKWGVSSYSVNTGLIENYVNPFIGDLQMQSVTSIVVDRYYKQLEKTRPVECNGRKPITSTLTPANIEKIHKLLRCAFDQAVRWELIGRNPFAGALIPKHVSKKREMWTLKTIVQAMDACTDNKLYLAMNLAFACSMRMGEILGLQWERVHIADEDIANDDAHIFVDRELARVNKKALEKLGDKGIIFKFPPVMSTCKTTVLVLKDPKSESSVRKVWLPKTLAYILREWRKSQGKLREMLGEEYVDYDLVITQPNGRPCENKLIEEAFNKLKATAGLPNVVFHSLRSSSTTYKLKLNHGDIKATQGDTGHAQADMVTEVYAQILDEDRKVNAQKFESMFYANPDLRNVTPPPEPTGRFDLAGLIDQLQRSPELASALARIISMPADVGESSY